MAVTHFSEVAVTGETVAADRAVTQITSVTTGVTINSSAGAITTVTQTALTDDQDTFTVTNDKVAAEDTVVLSIKSYSGTLGTNGMPCAVVTAVADGSFNITIANMDNATLSGVLVINFVIIKAGPDDAA